MVVTMAAIGESLTWLTYFISKITSTTHYEPFVHGWKNGWKIFQMTAIDLKTTSKSTDLQKVTFVSKYIFGNILRKFYENWAFKKFVS